MIRRFHPVAIALITGAIVLLGGTAFAYWSANGAGTGTAFSGQATNVVAQPLATGSATVNSKLTPGNAADLVVSVDNPNSFPVLITGIQQSGPITVTNGGTCNDATAGVSVPTSNTLAVTVPAKSSGIVHLVGAVTMSASSDNGCQGKGFAIPVTLKVQK